MSDEHQRLADAASLLLEVLEDHFDHRPTSHDLPSSLEQLGEHLKTHDLKRRSKP